MESIEEIAARGFPRLDGFAASWIECQLRSTRMAFSGLIAATLLIVSLISFCVSDRRRGGRAIAQARRFASRSRDAGVAGCRRAVRRERAASLIARPGERPAALVVRSGFVVRALRLCCVAVSRAVPRTASTRLTIVRRTAVEIGGAIAMRARVGLDVARFLTRARGRAGFRQGARRPRKRLICRMLVGRLTGEWPSVMRVFGIACIRVFRRMGGAAIHRLAGLLPGDLQVIVPLAG
ncbi:hypothetical protein A6456_37430 [Paraburkholderia tropica]|nr:hypothetical protein A6456_37430 [Paraburkholderia tropica]